MKGRVAELSCAPIVLRIRRGLAAVVLTASIAVAGRADAQLAITELMVNPISSNDNVWEWIEILNTGPTDVNLNGYIASKLNEAANYEADISIAHAENTIVPAGRAAVIYNGAPTNYDDALFRQAWNLPASVPLIAANGLPELSNSGANTNIGFWSPAFYNDALVSDGMGGAVVGNYAGAAFSIDYTAPGFPSIITNGPSIRWTGGGDYQVGDFWELNEEGIGGAAASMQVSTPTGALNDTQDRGNPGRVPTGPAAAGLLITEIMYDPASADATWEWVEIYNNTGATINFATTKYFFQDDDGADLTTQNLNSGLLPDGKAAIVFSNEITMQNMIDAWDPGGVNGTVFIPVANFPSLAQAGDTVALWNSLANYNLDKPGTGRSTAHAVAVASYDDPGSVSSPTGWPDPEGERSIYLNDLTDGPLNSGDPSKWSRSVVGDAVGSANAHEVLGVVVIHPGGDVGSPGTAPGMVVSEDADFDLSGLVDGHDVLIWQRNAVTALGASHSQGDANGNGSVDSGDLAIWKVGFGQPPSVSSLASLPEPGGMALAGFFGTTSIARNRRRKAIGV